MNKRNNEIDVVKFVFTICVFLYHSYALSASDTVPPILPLGYMCVEAFFIISGYYMSLSIDKKSNQSTDNIFVDNIKFIVRKISYFYPQYIVAFIFAFIGRNLFPLQSGIKEMLRNSLFISGEVFLQYCNGIIQKRWYYNGPTWYLSAMVIAMFILYPIIRNNLKRFTLYIAPIISLVGYGMLTHTFKCLDVAGEEWLYFINGGLLRALSGISLGCTVFAICKYIRSYSFKITKFCRIIATLAEVYTFAVILFLMQNSYTKDFKTAVDYSILVHIFVFLIIVFSQISYSNCIFSNKLTKILSAISLPIYLNHRVWIYVISDAFPNISFNKQFLLYCALTMVTALISIPLTNLLKYVYSRVKKLLVN